MSATLRACPDCGAGRRGSTCRRCGWQASAAKPPRADLRRGAPRRRAAVTAHLDAYGPVCPGWPDHKPHAVDPSQLTADHIVSVALGGDPDGPLQVLCRSHNSSKGAAERVQVRRLREGRW